MLSTTSFMYLIFAYAVLFFILMLAILASYLFQAVALYKMAKDRGIDYAWLAWIPVVNRFLLGELIGNKVKIASLSIPQAKYGLLFAPIVCSVLTAGVKQTYFILSLFGVIISILVTIYVYAGYYRAYKIYAPDKGVLLTALSAVFFWLPFLSGIFLFAIRKNTPQYLDD